MEQFLEVFFEEAEEHLANLEHLLLTLDVSRPDREALNGIFRAAHSIKGSSGMFGFDDLTAVTHVLETLLDKIRSDQIALRSEMIDVFLQARDVLAQLLACHKYQSVDPSIPVESTVARLQALIDSQSETHAGVAEDGAYGLFTAEPTQSEDEVFGFFDDTPGSTHTTTASEDAFGFFEEQPGSPNASVQAEAYGLFGEVATVAKDESFGFFDEQPGAPVETAEMVVETPSYGLYAKHPAARKLPMPKPPQLLRRRSAAPMLRWKSVAVATDAAPIDEPPAVCRPHHDQQVTMSPVQSVSAWKKSIASSIRWASWS
nr:Hpt domain-containing protein [Pseudomonas sp. HAR-UPW-AIA-41]